MVKRNLHACVVGLGSIGERHLSNLIDLNISSVVGVDTDPDARHNIEAEYDIQTASSLDAALDAHDIDFVVVATPNSLHIPIAQTGASAGCHLFVEKPLSDDMTGVNELIETVQTKNLTTLVGCNLRFSPPIQKIRDLLRQDTIGQVVSARIQGGSYLPKWYPESSYQESYSAREDLGGGVVLDYIHELNYARWLFGEFDTVTAVIGHRTSLDIETSDVAAIIADSVSGPLCEFHLDYIQRAYTRTCQVIGEEGTIEWSWRDETVEWYTASDDRWHSFEYSGWDSDQMYVDEMEHFLTCLDSETSTLCPIAEARRDLQLALAARDASETGRHVTLKRED